jgi:pteridine reductase
MKHTHAVALVTGAGRRIGAAIAEYLHRSGYSVAIHCRRSKNDADALCAQLNQQRKGSARVFVADLTIKQHNTMLIDEVVKWAGRLDLLVNNASVFLPSSIDTHEDVWSELFAINVQAPYWLSLAGRSWLAQHCGAIINITDIHAEAPLKGYTQYCQSKAALMMQTKAFAREFAPSVRVNAIAPGAIAWPECDNALSDEQQQKIIDKTLLKRHGKPHYIAEAVYALASNEFITGQTLRVDGGR